MRVPGSWGRAGGRRHLPSGRSWFLKQQCLQGPRHTCYGRETHRPTQRLGSGGGVPGPTLVQGEPHCWGLPGPQSSSSSSSLAGAVGGLSWTLKHSAKKLTMAP